MSLKDPNATTLSSRSRLYDAVIEAM